MLIGNYQLLNKVPGREFGGTTNVAAMWKESFREAIYLGEANIDGEHEKASLSNGTVPPYSWLLAPKAGGIASINEINGEGELTITSLALGKALDSTIAGMGTVSTANLSLVTSMAATIAGSGSLSASMVGVVNMACTLAGTGNLTAAMGALAYCVANLSGSGTLTSDLRGKLWMESNIYVNQSEATVQQIVDGVWEAEAVDHDVSGTMGEKLNAAGTAGDPWTTDLDPYTTAGTAGKILKDAADSAELASIK